MKYLKLVITHIFPKLAAPAPRNQKVSIVRNNWERRED